MTYLHVEPDGYEVSIWPAKHEGWTLKITSPDGAGALSTQRMTYDGALEASRTLLAQLRSENDGPSA